MPAPLDISELTDRMSAAAGDGKLVSLVLSGPQKDQQVPPRQDVRRVSLASGERLQWSARHDRQEHHENLTLEESLQRLQSLFGSAYRNAVLRTTAEETTARVTRRGRLQVRTQRRGSAPAPVDHNLPPQHLIPEGRPCGFLHALGVMTADGQVRARQQHKFRQINRYLEFIRDILPDLPAEGPLEIVDCGCGRSGLTFALHHYLTNVVGRDVRLTGLDWNESVLEGCRTTARALGRDDIAFRTGDIAAYEPPAPVNLVVSLHACDTATDAALARAIGWQADVILAVPCCQHELAPQLDSARLEGLLRHGILRERLAADATDALRAGLLELHGYRTQVLEFIELEHTPKNLLLRAVRRRTPISTTVLDRQRASYRALKELLGVTTFALERLLDEARAAVPSSAAPTE
jgi:hypothetical protein